MLKLVKLNAFASPRFLYLYKSSFSIKNSIYPSSENNINEPLVSITEDMLTKVPSWFFFLENPTTIVKDFLLSFIVTHNIELYFLLPVVCISLRLSLLPLTFLHTKYISKFISKYNIGKSCLTIMSNRRENVVKSFTEGSILLIKTSRALKLRMIRMCFFTVMHVPFNIFFVLVLRKLVADPHYQAQKFLWLSSPLLPDPYYTLPFLACSCYYIAFGYGITSLNKFTFIGKLKGFLQLCTIMWLPFLCCWPISISFYLLCNGIFSLGLAIALQMPSITKRLSGEALLSSQKIFLDRELENKQRNLLNIICSQGLPQNTTENEVYEKFIQLQKLKET